MSLYPTHALDSARAPAARRPWRLSTRAISTLTLTGVLALWWAVTATELIEPLFLPPPGAVLDKAWLLATQGYMDATL